MRVKERDAPAVELDPADLGMVLSERWSDYDGDSIYADYAIFEGSPATSRSFEPGVARMLSGLGQGDGWTDYYHTDHLGTTRRMTGPSGSVIASNSTVFSAFGERISGTLDGTEDRYGYVGAFGYQAHEEFQFPEILHVGARYYDPASGRFLQRDPIGIRGGLNAYAYALAAPTLLFDPLGLSALGDGLVGLGEWTMACAVIIGAAGLLHPPVAPIAEPAAAATGIVGALSWIVGKLINLIS